MKVRVSTFIWHVVLVVGGLFMLTQLQLSAEARSGTGVELFSGVGYKSNSEGPTLLLGAELLTFNREGNFFSGLEETKIGLHLSDVLSLDSNQQSTFTVGVDGQWTRLKGPTSFSLGGRAFYRWQGSRSARTVSVMGTGASGRIHGRIRADYVESSLGTFPWFQQDLEGFSETAGDGPFYRAQLGVTASVIPAYRLNWSQEVKWRRPVSEGPRVMSVTTGPQFDVGSGTLGAQGGVLFDNGGVAPIWQIRYEHRPFQSNVDFQLTMATRSLDGDEPVVYGWIGVVGQRVDFGAAIHFEKSSHGTLEPAIYFSVHPKF